MIVLQEADIDDDEEANAVSDWDQMTANQAYTEQIRAAEEEEKRRAEAEAEREGTVASRPLRQGTSVSAAGGTGRGD